MTGPGLGVGLPSSSGAFYCRAMIEAGSPDRRERRMPGILIALAGLGGLALLAALAILAYLLWPTGSPQRAGAASRPSVELPTGTFDAGYLRSARNSVVQVRSIA